MVSLTPAAGANFLTIIIAPLTPGIRPLCPVSVYDLMEEVLSNTDRTSAGAHIRPIACNEILSLHRNELWLVLIAV